MSSQRPVYIPKRRSIARRNDNFDPGTSKIAEGNTRNRRQRQKQQQPRFHGAFTGGFSAGYFNTVGTKEGWMPSQSKKTDQRLEDYMDEEDHSSWGGPTRVRDEYGTKEMAITDLNKKDRGDSLSVQSNMAQLLPITSMLELSHQTVGPRLLRRLGWREGGIAIVPENSTTPNLPATETTVKNGDNSLENLARVHLSRRRLRKIKLQSSRIKLPPPKLDLCGLGFEPYKDAPEFQQYREKRKQRARDRASFNTRANVYRISDVAAPVNGSDRSNGLDRLTSSHQPQDGNGGEYLSYETAEDFVGKRSAAGFALRDDEDDAYDDDLYYNRNKRESNGDQIQSTRLNRRKVGDEYNTEVYEHVSSDDDYEHNSNVAPAISRNVTSGAGKGMLVQPLTQHSNDRNKKNIDVGTMFAAWAGNHDLEGKASSTPRVAALTSEGRPPLSGFMLGVCINNNKRRYTGPDIPRDYTIQRHEFGEHENPYVLEAISNAVRLELKQERKSQIRINQERKPQIKGIHDDTCHPLSKNFLSLGEAMKKRFTSSTEEPLRKGESTAEISKTFPAGLHIPEPVQKNRGNSTNILPGPESASRKISIKRTSKSFFPNALLCKRFHVPVPTNARRNNDLIATDEKMNNESTYFEREILGKVRGAKKKSSRNVDDATKFRIEIQANEEGKNQKVIDRPSIEKLRSIFQASSDESLSSEDYDSDEVREKTDVDEEQPLQGDANHFQEGKRPLSLAQSDVQTKDGSDSKSIEVSRSQQALQRGDEVGNSSSTSGNSDNDSSSVEMETSPERRKGKHRRKHHSHRKRKKKRKRSRSTSREHYVDRTPKWEESDERRKDRRSREQKRRKKKSSRHKPRKRREIED